MLRLANELHLSIATQLESERDINALARTNRRLFACLDPFLYHRNVQQSGSSALQWAAIHGQGRTVKRAIDAKCDGIGEAMGLSVRNGQEEVMRILLAIDGVDGDWRDEDGRTALLYAAAEGRKSIVKLLLDSGRVEIDLGDNCDRTPLFWATASEHEAVVKLLLDSGRVEIDSRDNCDWTPLVQAAAVGNEAIVKLLLELEKGADVEAKDKDSGRAPLWRAAERGDEAIVRLLQRKFR
ncbi:ankyrin repeat-containing domain protein [Ilyonectria destructans]|nr:ankyrin repeat-containing domain protein [Ilyonectria destructans]